MSTFETTATVEEHGRVLVAGVPFTPDTEVEVTVLLQSEQELSSSTIRPFRPLELEDPDEELPLNFGGGMIGDSFSMSQFHRLHGSFFPASLADY